ncbi:MAG: peptidoglycan DD-metalloendopeptidase family protein, partial [Pseudomonadota bacterium]
MVQSIHGVTGALAALAALAVGACTSGGSGQAPAPVEIAGTDPGGTTAAPTATAGAAAGNGIVAYNGYEAALAQDGDTVATVAERIGLSASELGAYNGLSPSHPLRGGDELVLPPRPGGYSPRTEEIAAAPDALDGAGVPVDPATGEAVAGAQTPAPVTIAGTDPGTVPGTGLSHEATSAGATGLGTSTVALSPIGDGAVAATDPAAASAEEALAAAEPGGGAGSGDAWSPDLAEAAIARSEGLDGSGGLGVPPSSAEPLPETPVEPRDLQSPGLSQYQTPGRAGVTPGAIGGAQAAETAAAEIDDTAATELARTEAATAPPEPAVERGKLTLLRPVDGPIAVGYGQGVGQSRNEGLDFAAPAGSPVIAAADGEIALVSQSLGGLGTIVLIRHPNDI